MNSDSQRNNKLQQNIIENPQDKGEYEDIDMKMIDRVRLATRIRNLNSYQTTNGPATFNGYLDIWCVNPSQKILSSADDTITNSKIQEINTAFKLTACLSFTIMATFYKLANGFQCTWPKYFKYPRHIICIGAGTFILPKYFMYGQVSQIFDFLKYQQEKYETTDLWKENVGKAEKQLERFETKEFFEEKFKKNAFETKKIQQNDNNTGEINEK